MAIEEEVTSVNGGGDEGSSKAPRLPRWTRHEILVLIQGKRVAENRVRRGGRTAGLDQPEPKWASVSSYCRRHGVIRGPVQCRKRWSNLAGDFKKIKEWESSVKEDSDSFWVMRNDLRRERKLPGFFDKEVYDILDGTAPTTALPAPVQELPEGLIDGGRSAPPEEGLLSEEDFDKETQAPIPISFRMPIPAPVPISERPYQPPFDEGLADQGATEKQEPGLGSTSQQGKKRKHGSTQETDPETETERVGTEDHLIQVLAKNGSILGAHLEALNTNLKEDREERKVNNASLIAVLDKFADALSRIADKL